MLPTLLRESDFTPFKFWFDGVVQDGICYQNELFCRLRSVPIKERVHLYRDACRLNRDNAVVVTLDRQTCSLWISLRSPHLADLRQQNSGCAADPLS